VKRIPLPAHKFATLPCEGREQEGKDPASEHEAGAIVFSEALP